MCIGGLGLNTKFWNIEYLNKKGKQSCKNKYLLKRIKLAFWNFQAGQIFQEK